MTPESRAIIDRMIDNVPVDFTDEQFASHVVGLLIYCKGDLNRYKHTIEICLEVYRRCLERRKSCQPRD